MHASPAFGQAFREGDRSETASCAAARGTTIPRTAARRIGTGTTVGARSSLAISGAGVPLWSPQRRRAAALRQADARCQAPSLRATGGRPRGSGGVAGRRHMCVWGARLMTLAVPVTPLTCKRLLWQRLWLGMSSPPSGTAQARARGEHSTADRPTHDAGGPRRARRVAFPLAERSMPHRPQSARRPVAASGPSGRSMRAA